MENKNNFQEQKDFKEENPNENIKKEGEMATKKRCKKGSTRSKKTGKCVRKPKKRLVSKKKIRKFFGG